VKTGHPIGAKPDASPLDAIPYVTEAVIDCTFTDGTRKRYVLTGEMRARLTQEMTKRSMMLGFEFDNPATIQEVDFPGDACFYGGNR
jgi:hypothetical protein